MASMRDIKRRRSSIQSTQQITKAMKLVSTVKLQKARQRAEGSKHYFHQMYETIQSILSRTESIPHPYLEKEDSKGFSVSNNGKGDSQSQKEAGGKKAVVVISSNRGLAGGYNSNVARKLVEQGFAPENVELYTVGQKARDYLSAKGYRIWKDYSQAIENPTYEDGAIIGKELLEAFGKKQVVELYLVYTEFVNTVSQVPRIRRLLPVKQKATKVQLEEVQKEALENTKEAITLMNYEPNPETVVEYLIPIYIQSLIYGAMVEAIASENSARMQAMDNATGNAEEMIRELSLKFNRARQHSITQELTEIIAGADAIC